MANARPVMDDPRQSPNSKFLSESSRKRRRRSSDPEDDDEKRKQPTKDDEPHEEAETARTTKTTTTVQVRSSTTTTTKPASLSCADMPLCTSTDQQRPAELSTVDFTKRVTWGKYEPYDASPDVVASATAATAPAPAADASCVPRAGSRDDDGDDPKNSFGTSTTSARRRVVVPLPTVPVDTPPIFTADSTALCHYVHACSLRARACTIHFPPPSAASSSSSLSRPVPTPMFMPVGTKACLKCVSMDEWTRDPALACPIILANTYHLAIQPGTELVRDLGGLASFQGLRKAEEQQERQEQRQRQTKRDNEATAGIAQQERMASYNLLTDSGGFQMVSLAKLSRVTEEGVSFQNPFTTNNANNKGNGWNSKHGPAAKEVNAKADDNNNDNDMLLLTPEDSIRHQNNIGANIIMALDDVVSSVSDNEERFRTATYRTLRWYDRCYEAHAERNTQNLFPIVQGGLDTSLGGLREECLAGFRHRDQALRYAVPGFAIGGLAGGESKDAFWKVVDQCCRALPDDRPRYLMGVGYPLDLVVCTALGVDLYDCVYPTRTARFGVALVPGPAPGTLKLKQQQHNNNAASTAPGGGVIQQGCQCQACLLGISRARLQQWLKTGNPVAIELITQHNIAYMMNLVRTMRRAILDNTFAQYAISFVKEQYPGEAKGGQDAPAWVVDALAAAGITLPAD